MTAAALREQFHWKVRVQNERGAVSIEDVWAYWSPSTEGIEEAVRQAAVAQASGKNRQLLYVGLEVELVP